MLVLCVPDIDAIVGHADDIVVKNHGVHGCSVRLAIDVSGTGHVRKRVARDGPVALCFCGATVCVVHASEVGAGACSCSTSQGVVNQGNVRVSAILINQTTVRCSASSDN